MPDFERDGITIHYETQGDPATPAVVLLHGFTSDHRMWLPVVEALRESFYLIAPDLRGHGRSGAPEAVDAYSMETYAEDLQALLGHLQVDLCVLAGCSFGGMVALQFAVTWPERIAGLVLTDSSPAPESERYDEAFRQREQKMLEAEELVQRLGTAGLGRRAAAGVHDPFLAEGIRHRYAAMRAEGFLGAAKVRRERPNLIPVLRERITCPVLLCVGDKDPAAAGTRVLAEELPGARVVTFKGTGHGVPALRPDTFIEVLVQFFRDLEEGNPTDGGRTV